MQKCFQATAFIIALLGGVQTAEADLESALREGFFRLNDDSNAPRSFFLPDSLGNDYLEPGPPPALVYDPQNGNLIALESKSSLRTIPLNEIGTAPPTNLPSTFKLPARLQQHQVSGLELQISDDLFDITMVVEPTVTILQGIADPITEITEYEWVAASDRINYFALLPNRLSLTTTLGYKIPRSSDETDNTPRILAAKIDFGTILPKDLTEQQLQLAFTNSSGEFWGAANYANFANEINFHHPFEIISIPEPSSFKLSVIVCVILMLGNGWSHLACKRGKLLSN